MTKNEVRISAPSSRDHLKPFTRALISYLVAEQYISEAVLWCLIKLSTAKYFPLQFLLAQAFQMELHYEIY